MARDKKIREGETRLCGGGGGGSVGERWRRAEVEDSKLMKKLAHHDKEGSKQHYLQKTWKLDFVEEEAHLYRKPDPPQDG